MGLFDRDYVIKTALEILQKENPSITENDVIQMIDNFSSDTIDFSNLLETQGGWALILLLFVLAPDNDFITKLKEEYAKEN